MASRRLNQLPFSEENKKKIVAAINGGESAQLYIPANFAHDKDVVLAAVAQYGGALRYAGKLSNDAEVAIAAIKQSPWAIKYASSELFHNREFMLQVCVLNGFSLEYTSESLKSDEEVVMLAVQQDGLSLEFASEELRRNSRICEAALKNDGRALQFVAIPDEDMDIRTLVEVCHDYPLAIEFVPVSLRKQYKREFSPFEYYRDYQYIELPNPFFRFEEA
jgi:hypothetical protein